MADATRDTRLCCSPAFAPDLEIRADLCLGYRACPDALPRRREASP